MDDPLSVNFRNFQSKTIETIQVSKKDDFETIRCRWSDITKCRSESYRFSTTDGKLLPSEGSVSDIINKDDFFLDVDVKPVEQMTDSDERRPRSANPTRDVLVSQSYGNQGTLEKFVPIERVTDNFRIGDLRSAVESELHQRVQLKQRYVTESTGDHFEETVDGFMSSDGRLCTTSPKRMQRKERLLEDSESIVVSGDHVPVISLSVVGASADAISEISQGISGLSATDGPAFPPSAVGLCSSSIAAHQQQQPEVVNSSVERSPASGIASSLPDPSSGTAVALTTQARFHISYRGANVSKKSFVVDVPCRGLRLPVSDLRAAVEAHLSAPVLLRQKRGRADGEEVFLAISGYVSAAGRQWKIQDVEEKRTVKLQDSDAALTVPVTGLPVIFAFNIA